MGVGDYTFPAPPSSWSDAAITVTIPGDAVAIGLATGQLTVTRTNGRASLTGVTVTVGEPGGMVWRVGPTQRSTVDPGGGRPGGNGDLILVDPGTYHENVIVYKPVRIQGAGAWSTVINAMHYPGDALQAWRRSWRSSPIRPASSPDGRPCIGLLEGQDEVQPLFLGQEGPGFLVVPAPGRFNRACGRGSMGSRSVERISAAGSS